MDFWISCTAGVLLVLAGKSSRNLLDLDAGWFWKEMSVLCTCRGGEVILWMFSALLVWTSEKKAWCSPCDISKKKRMEEIPFWWWRFLTLVSLLCVWMDAVLGFVKFGSS